MRLSISGSHFGRVRVCLIRLDILWAGDNYALPESVDLNTGLSQGGQHLLLSIISIDIVILMLHSKISKSWVSQCAINLSLFNRFHLRLGNSL